MSDQSRCESRKPVFLFQIYRVICVSRDEYIVIKSLAQERLIGIFLIYDYFSWYYDQPKVISNLNINKRNENRNRKYDWSKNGL
jgi:hypothetical protein